MNYALIRTCVKVTADAQLASQGVVAAEVLDLMSELDAMLAPVVEAPVVEAPVEAPVEEAPANE